MITKDTSNWHCLWTCYAKIPRIQKALLEAVDEGPSYERNIAFLMKSYPSVYDLQFLQENIFMIPVPFAKYHREMLSHCKEMLENRNGYVEINPVYNKLITALRTTVDKGDSTLDKGATSHDDLFDALRQSLQFWR